MSDGADRRSIIEAFQRLSNRISPDNNAGYTKYKKRNADNGEPNPSSFYSNQREKERHEHHHRIQEKIYWVSYIVVTILALGAASAAAYFAHGAYTEAQRQADAAEYVNRAFIYSENLKLSRFDPETKLWAVYPTWNNSGNTPAVSMYVATACKWVYGDSNDAADFPNIPMGGSGQHAIGAPKQTTDGGICPFIFIGKSDLQTQKYRVVSIDTINKRKQTVFFAGKICYKKALRQRKWSVSEFYGRILYVYIKEDNTGEISFRFLGDHNCVDEDCPDYETACNNLPKAR